MKLCSEHCTKCYEVGGTFFCDEGKRAGNEGIVDENQEIPQVCIKNKYYVERDTKTPSLFEE